MAGSETATATVGRTLPEHEKCDRHKHYKLSCLQYERMLSESGRACQICRGAWTNGKPHIDHYGSQWAVRGLLYVGCNVQLMADNVFRPEAAGYLANPWWSRQCAALDLPTDLGAEPPVGSAIRNQWDSIYVRISDRRWYGAPRKRNSYARCWRTLYSTYGPQNLVPYDLRAALDDGSMPDEIGYPIAHGTEWTAVRSVLGVPEPARKRREWQPRDSFPWLSTPERAVAALRVFLGPEECLRIGELLREEA